MQRKRREDFRRPTSLFRKRRWRRFGAALVLGVFFLNALAPVWLAERGFAGIGRAAETAGEAGPDSTILICTGAGLKLVRLDGNGEPVSGSDRGDGFCVLCLPFYSMAGIAAAADPAFAKPTFIAGNQPQPIEEGLLRPSVSSGSSSPRAPPGLS